MLKVSGFDQPLAELPGVAVLYAGWADTCTTLVLTTNGSMSWHKLINSKELDVPATGSSPETMRLVSRLFFIVWSTYIATTTDRWKFFVEFIGRLRLATSDQDGRAFEAFELSVSTAGLS
jgi:hypothetical protein